MVNIGTFDLDNRAAIVAAIDKEPLKSSMRALEMGADVLEIRLDLLDITDPEVACHILREVRSKTYLPCIATNRLHKEGGKCTSSERERTGLLENILACTDAIDIELSADEECRDRLIKKAKELGKTVIVSSHFFESTPDSETMQRVIDSSLAAGCDIAKLAVMPQDTHDTLRLLELSLRNKDVCTIAMGNIGRHTRVIAPLYGSKLTYAAVSAEVAPGQLPVDELRKAMETIS